MCDCNYSFQQQLRYNISSFWAHLKGKYQFQDTADFDTFVIFVSNLFNLWVILSRHK